MRINWRLVWKVKGRGARSRRSPVSSGKRSPFGLLQAWQQATRLSQSVWPPRERGIT